MKSVAVAAGMALLGAGMVVGATVGMSDTSSGWYLSMVCLGTGLLIGFGAKLLLSAGELVHADSGSPVKPYSLFFKAEELERLKVAIEQGNSDVFVRMAGDPGSGLRMDALLAQNDKFAACQLFRYVPYHYEEASEVYPIQDAKCHAFCACVRTLYAAQSVE